MKEKLPPREGNDKTMRTKQKLMRYGGRKIRTLNNNNK